MGIIDRLNDTSVKNDLKSLDEQQDFDFRLMEEILDQYTGSPNSDYEKRIRRLHLREMALSDEERVSPDTYGCDCIFLRYFVNEQMEDDFDLIARDDTMQQEIDALRVELHRLENNEKALRGTVAQKDKIIQEQNALIQKYEEDQDELTALRNHVYNLTQDDTEATPVSFSAMKAAIASLRIVVIGGHDNWTSKMKQEFPDWTFIHPGASGTADKSLILNADKVYFFTDSISHSIYYRYVQIAREQKVPFGYIHGVNINMNVAQIYREMGATP